MKIKKHMKGLLEEAFKENLKVIKKQLDIMNSPKYKQKKVEDTLTLDDIVQVVKQLPKPENILERIVLCKKHWKALEKETVFKENNNPLWGSLSGVQVVIKPYLKKARLYYKNL